MFWEDKFDDVIGPRRLCDTPPDPLMRQERKERFGFWIYEWFRLRRLFGTNDPLQQSPVGTFFTVGADCENLLCLLQGVRLHLGGHGARGCC